MSYGDLTGWKAYAAARGVALTGNDTVLGQALLRAQDYIRISYVNRFAPGYDATATDVDSACYEAAVKEMATPGFWTKVFTESDRKVLNRLGDLSWQVTGTVTGTGLAKDYRSMAPRSTKIETLLWLYLARTYGAIAV